MAEAGDEDAPTGWAWVLYSKYSEDKLAEILVLEQADHLGRKDIRERRLRYRYRDRDNNLRYDYWLDHDGNLHYDSLTDEFWREAILDLQILDGLACPGPFLQSRRTNLRGARH